MWHVFTLPPISSLKFLYHLHRRKPLSNKAPVHGRSGTGAEKGSSKGQNGWQKTQLDETWKSWKRCELMHSHRLAGWLGAWTTETLQVFPRQFAASGSKTVLCCSLCVWSCVVCYLLILLQLDIAFCTPKGWDSLDIYTSTRSRLRNTAAAKLVAYLWLLLESQGRYHPFEEMEWFADVVQVSYLQVVVVWGAQIRPGEILA